jgi:ActR/RegA family two-component response regulator
LPWCPAVALRLLLVDDDDAIAFAMRRYFTLRGFVVDCAAELEEAQALLSNFHYTAVFADLRLTGVHGVEGLDLIGHVRQVSPMTRTLLLTAYSSPELAEEAAKRGASAVVRKPTALPDLERLLLSLLETA